MTVLCESFEQMMEAICILTQKGFTFTADTSTLTIKLTGGW